MCAERDLEDQASSRWSTVQQSMSCLYLLLPTLLSNPQHFQLQDPDPEQPHYYYISFIRYDQIQNMRRKYHEFIINITFKIRRLPKETC